MSPEAVPILVMENDPALRLLGVVLDPHTSEERYAAFAHYMAHDLPDFDAWCERVQHSAGGLYPAELRLVDTQAELLASLPGASGLVVESLEVGRPELETGDRLSLVQKFGTVTRNIDLAACATRGVQVLTLRRRVNIACAEHTLALMLVFAKRLDSILGLISVEQLTAAGYAPTSLDRSHTPNANWARITGIRMLYESTLGIVGLGEIGRELALQAAGFGMRVLYFQRTPLLPDEERAWKAEYAPLDALLAASDWVSIQLPLTPSTRGLIDETRLAQMKAGAVLINTSRPDIVDRGAVLSALRSGQLGGLALDPSYEEPGRPDDPLLSFENVLLTPHTAASPRFNSLTDCEEMVAGLAHGLGLSR